MALPNRLNDFEIIGAGINEANGRYANGRYFVSCWGANSCPEYSNSSNREFRIERSEEDLAYSLQKPWSRNPVLLGPSFVTRAGSEVVVPL